MSDEGRSNVEVLTDAITHERPLFGIYYGYERLFCPVLLGTTGRGRGTHTQVYLCLFGGEIRPGPVPEPGLCRCFDVRKLSDLRFLDDPWRAGPPASKPPWCIDRRAPTVTAPSYALPGQEAP